MPYVILVVFPQVLFKMLQSSYIYHKGEVFPSAFIPHVGMERQPLQICVYKHLLVQETLYRKQSTMCFFAGMPPNVKF